MTTSPRQITLPDAEWARLEAEAEKASVSLDEWLARKLSDDVLTGFVAEPLPVPRVFTFR